MSGFWKQSWLEWRGLYFMSSFGLDWTWWGIGTALSVDFREKELDFDLTIGPFRVYLSGGKFQE